MNIGDGVILGIIQGLTEFLPVSSSGHLVLARASIGIEEAGITFGVIVHLGTLVAVLWSFRSDIFWILKGTVRKILSKACNVEVSSEDNDAARLMIFLALGSLPAGFFGLFLQDRIDELFGKPLITAIMLLITGTILYAASKKECGKIDIPKLRWHDVIWIGAFQALAIFPGISRSGSTISGGLFKGLERETAARFSFLLSIPIILGAGILKIGDISTMSPSVLPGMIGGFIAAALSGYFAIYIVMQVIKSGKLVGFAYYCWAVGFIGILFFS